MLQSYGVAIIRASLVVSFCDLLGQVAGQQFAKADNAKVYY
jgi:hypothetical protein